MVDAGTVELVRGIGVDRDLGESGAIFRGALDAGAVRRSSGGGSAVDHVRREAFERIGEKLRASEHVTEWEIQQFIAARFREEGLFADHGPDVAVNANASNPHYDPKQDSASAIKKGDIVLIDMWAKLNQPDAVYYDITWMGSCGQQPPSAMERVFGIVKEARDRAIKCAQDAV